MSHPPQQSGPFGGPPVPGVPPAPGFGPPPGGTPPKKKTNWLKAFLLGLVVPGVVIGLVMGIITLVKPQVVLGAVTNPLVWLFMAGAVVVGALIGGVSRLLKAPGWLAFGGFWLPVVVATAYGVAPAFIVTSINEEAPDTTAAASQTPGPAGSGSPSAPARPAATEVGRAALSGIGHKASGTARVIRTAGGSYVVRFENFTIEQGPDFRIHLVPGAHKRSPGQSADLGGLKASSGNQNYQVPAGTTVTTPVTVLVWCRAFQVPVASATITA
ncbi:DM13 domain-containing protein [Fodinicola acaciae]|uniref:DM13 domain-containing protein n=1 Tax=Fodinicola acaciae TaxID=2681555 RepID=UPI0013D10FD2|nr:DM13 domain-containing protein [Fodinicola acaciae]